MEVNGQGRKKKGKGCPGPTRGRGCQIHVGLLCDFQCITGYISETERDRCIVSTKSDKDVICAVLNVDIANDPECL